MAPAPLPITQTLADISAMENAFDQSSCADREPFIKYPDTGNPPTIQRNHGSDNLPLSH